MCYIFTCWFETRRTFTIATVFATKIFPVLMPHSQVCQYNNLPGKEDQAVSLGAVSDLQWMAVTDERNFEILITGGDKTFSVPPKQRYLLLRIYKQERPHHSSTGEGLAVVNHENKP